MSFIFVIWSLEKNRCNLNRTNFSCFLIFVFVLFEISLNSLFRWINMQKNTYVTCWVSVLPPKNSLLHFNLRHQVRLPTSPHQTSEPPPMALKAHEEKREKEKVSNLMNRDEIVGRLVNYKLHLPYCTNKSPQTFILYISYFINACYVCKVYDSTTDKRITIKGVTTILEKDLQVCIHRSNSVVTMKLIFTEDWDEELQIVIRAS